MATPSEMSPGVFSVGLSSIPLSNLHGLYKRGTRGEWRERGDCVWEHVK